MKRIVWKRVNRWIAFGCAYGAAFGLAVLGAIAYGAYHSYTIQPVSRGAMIAMIVILGLFMVPASVFMVVFLLESLFEGITGWRPVHPIMYRLGFNPNAHLARGETPIDLSRYRTGREEK